MKAGYKQTEVGVIPEDWDVAPLSNLKPFVTSGSRGWAAFYADKGDFFVRITNMSRGSIYLDLSNPKYVLLPESDSEGQRTRLSAGDLLISITADIGIAAFVDATVPSPAYINQHIALVRIDRDVADSQFIAYFLAAEPAQRRFRAITDTGAKAGMNLSTVLGLLTALPPLPEQRAIAGVLSDVDAAVAGLEALIAKKRDLKTATMTRLLTAQTRLPGFSGEWQVKRLGDVLAVRHGKSQKNIEVPNGRFPILATGGIIGQTDIPLYEKESVLIGRKGTIDRPQYMSTPFWSVDTLFYTEMLGETVAKFIFYRFLLVDWRQYNEASGVPSLSSKTIEKIEIKIPPTTAEQIAIAEVLSDMDGEITALQSQLDKTRQIKTAMMQDLLTGRTRLKV